MLTIAATNAARTRRGFKKGTATTPAGRLTPAAKDPIVYRFLLPDFLQESSEYLSKTYVFTLAGKEFWQIPVSQNADVTRRNKLRGLADWLILFLARAPAQLPLTASLVDSSRGDAVMVALSNADAYARRASYDRKTGRTVMIEHEYRGNRGELLRARLMASEFTPVDGYLLPRVVLQSLSDGAEPIRIEFTRIAVNKDVSARDFQRR